MLAKALLGAGKSAVPAYVEDVFSTWLYTGTGATQTITNGIDLAGKGGLTWIKGRSAATNHALYDTVRGATFDLVSNSTAAQTTQATGLTAFSSTGFSIGALAKLNTNAATYASWTFREQAKFFDIVTFTGNGTSQTISHNLGSAPGCMIVKRTDGVSNWRVWHRGMSPGYYAYLDTSGAQINTANQNVFGNGTTYVDPTSTVFTVGPSFVSGTYVAYLFAHNAGGFGLTGTDNVISCGSYTGNGSLSGPTVTLGYEPQWLMVKQSSASTTNWYMWDNMRGFPVGGNDAILFANILNEETTTVNYIDTSATGFIVKDDNAAVNASGQTYIYIAIRRGPMKTPTSGTSVFSPIAVTNSAGSNNTTNFPVDLQINSLRSAASKLAVDRLRGVSTTATNIASQLVTNSTAAEAGSGAGAITRNWSNTGFQTSDEYGSLSTIYWNFRRAPGFFDVVCYTGTGANTTVSHNLGVAPELVIIKQRASAQGWRVGSKYIANTGFLSLELTNEVFTDATTWNSTYPSATSISLGSNANVNENLKNHVAYLFATLAGVSKVGSYTGNGTSLTIPCGFTAGARFVMIKRTDSTGDWYVWDTARGIVSGNDPRLSLNSTAAEVTTDDTIDPNNSGFIVNQVAATNVNVTSATYIFFSIA